MSGGENLNEASICGIVACGKHYHSQKKIFLYFFDSYSGFFGIFLNYFLGAAQN